MIRRQALAGPAALSALGALAALGTGCASFAQEPVAPMPVLRLPAPPPCAATAGHLLVMLPAAASRAQDFVDEGFVLALRERGRAVHVALPEAHTGYYQARSIVTRLAEDVLKPARAKGQRVWLVGISLGGYGALACAARHGAGIDGVLAIAPWLGRRTIQRDIMAAGGPLLWRRNAKPSGAEFEEAEDLDHELWMWLSADDAATRRPPVYLSYGREDRLAGMHSVMATLLAPQHAHVIAGGHDWPTWRKLWQQWLALDLLPGGCAPRSGLIRGRREP